MKANLAYSAIPFSLSGNKLESVYLSNTIDGFVTIFGALSCNTEKYCAKLLSNECIQRLVWKATDPKLYSPHVEVPFKLVDSVTANIC